MLREEMETTITFTMADENAIVGTSILAWIRKMDSMVQEFPDTFKVKRDDGDYKEYEFPKRYVRISRPREASDAVREHAKLLHTMKKITKLGRMNDGT